MERQKRTHRVECGKGFAPPNDGIRVGGRKCGLKLESTKSIKLYSIYKLNKNKTWSAFWQSGAFFWNFGSAAVMAILWYGGILMFGMSGKKIGTGMGPSIAFALFASGTVLFANLFGWLAGEWKGASRQTIRGFVIGMALVVAAILLIAFGVNRS